MEVLAGKPVEEGKRMDEHPNRRRAVVGRCSHEESKRGLPERVNRNPPTVRKKMKRNKREKKGPKHWLSSRLGRRWWWLCSWPQVVLGVGSELGSWPRRPWRGTRAREKRGRERERERASELASESRGRLEQREQSGSFERKRGDDTPGPMVRGVTILLTILPP